jgi:hypothetical protein
MNGVPQAVQEAVTRWRDRGSPDQGPTKYRREAWMERLPRLRAVIADLPAELDRAAVSRELERLAAAPDWPLPSFVVTQIWGYGTRGYRPARVARVLTEGGLRVVPALTEAVTRLRVGAPEDAIAVFEGGEHNLSTWGPPLPPSSCSYGSDTPRSRTRRLRCRLAGRARRSPPEAAAHLDRRVPPLSHGDVRMRLRA